MLELNDYLDIKRGRAICPVHGTKDRNLAVKYDQGKRKWTLHCFSHNCSLEDIAQAAGFRPQDIYDDKDPNWQPPRPVQTSQDAGGILTLIRKAENAAPQITIAQKIEDTFGENPCENLKLHNSETGETLEIPCNGKRCEHCSPRKILTMRLQMREAFGEYTYVLRTSDPSRHIARLKKQAQRAGVEWLYQSVGDDYLGYILISNLPIEEGQNRTSLADWLERVVHQWMRGDKRIRRTRSIGRLSLLPIGKRAQRGTSPWARTVAERTACSKRAISPKKSPFFITVI